MYRILQILALLEILKRNLLATKIYKNYATNCSNLHFTIVWEYSTYPCFFFVYLQVLGLLVWTLIAGTEYFLYPVFGWVMFVAVFYWVLTLFFLTIYITMTYTRIPQVPWTSVGLCFNGSAFVLYFIAAVVDAYAVTKELNSHNYNSWAASSFFAFVVTSCYGGNTYFSFLSWKSRTSQ
uniref:CKLF like MARVEL transmembrane domain containing 8 n=1 Tax=Salvator merianae TaxID=96440 RepID=A0A8D0BWI3_SALMN